jgi:DNA replication and repair protein RecF
MKILDVYIKNFRKFSELAISFDNKFLIKGPNGSGKTSILESCYLSLCGKSFRTSHIKEIVKSDKESLFTKCRIEDLNHYSREVSVGIDVSGNKKLMVDGNSISRKELLDIFTSVVHSPDDMQVIEGALAKRRDFIDKAAFIEDRSYYDDMMNYLRYIKQKSASLKKNNRKAVIYLNEAVIPVMNRIRNKRSDICSKINCEISETVKKIFPELTLDISSYTDDDPHEKLEQKLDKELEKGYLLYGPHLDSVNLKYQAGESRNMSMGEKYMMSIILKLSELYLHAKREIYPVFFIDDVFVFLDDNKKQLMLDTIVKLKNQVIMTTSMETSDIVNDVKVFKIN